MRVTASIKNDVQKNEISVTTDGNEKRIDIPVKVAGRGALVNGGELLFLSLATCCCNDIYREAAKRNMEIDSVEVVVSGAFGKEGEPASNITYEVNIVAPTHTQQEISDVITFVDNIAEVHNTVRKGIPVSLKKIVTQ